MPDICLRNARWALLTSKHRTMKIGRAKPIAEAWQPAGHGTRHLRHQRPSRMSLPSPAHAYCPAIRIFLDNREAAHAPSTLSRYHTFTRQLTDFANQRGYGMRDQFTSADIDVSILPGNPEWIPRAKVSARCALSFGSA